MFSTFKMLNGLFNLSREIDSLKMNIPLPTRDIGKMRLIWFSRRQWWYVCRLHAHKHPIDSLFKALDTFGYCQRPVYSNMHKIINLWNCLLILSSMLQESNAIKTTLVPQICVPIKRLVLLFEWNLFLKTTLLQREPFLSMCCTISSSPLLIAK